MLDARAPARPPCAGAAWPAVRARGQAALVRPCAVRRCGLGRGGLLRVLGCGAWGRGSRRGQWAAPRLGPCQRALQPRPGAQVESLAALEDARPVCSVAWTQRGAYLAVGTNKGVVRIYDAAAVRGRAPRRTPRSGGMPRGSARVALRMRGVPGAVAGAWPADPRRACQLGCTAGAAPGCRRVTASRPAPLAQPVCSGRVCTRDAAPIDEALRGRRPERRAADVCGRGALCRKGRWRPAEGALRRRALQCGPLDRAAARRAQKTLVRELCLHRGRVGALAWGGHTLATGGQDRRILLTDLRAPAPAARLAGHKAEVCGLKARPRSRPPCAPTGCVAASRGRAARQQGAASAERPAGRLLRASNGADLETGQ
jgi:hypothetical protein